MKENIEKNIVALVDDIKDSSLLYLKPDYKGSPALYTSLKLISKPFAF